jgi:hypothetical protein
MKVFFSLTSLLILASCSGNFSSALGTTVTPPTGDCGSIVSATPSATNLIIPGSASSAGTTFGVVNTGTCVVTYTVNGTTVTGNNGNPFITLAATSFSAGTNTVVASASDGLSSSSQTWSVTKNTPPTLNSQVPASAGNALNYANNITLIANVTDALGNPLTATWLLNEVAAPSLFTISNTGANYQAVFQPTLTQVGANTITLQISDGYDTTSVNWAVTVTSGTVSVSSCSPSGTTLSSPDIITPSGGSASQTFSVTATGTGLTYAWILEQPGGSTFSTIAGKNTAVITLTQANLPSIPGVYTLNAVVTDAYNNTAQCPANIFVKSSSPPVFNGSPTPPISSAVKINVNATTTANTLYGQAVGLTPGTGGTATDADGDTLTYTWTIDGAVNSSVLPSGSFTSTFNPNGTLSLLGNHVITVTANDTAGALSTSVSWNVNVNYFSTFCNNLAAGSICTLVGNPGVGAGLNPTANQNLIRTQPRYFALHQVGSVYNIAWSDQVSHTVWYYNQTTSSVSYFGTTIPAGLIEPIFGSGQQGTLSTTTPTTANTPLGIAINNDNTADPVMYIAIYASNRVLAISNSLGIQTWFTGSNLASSNSLVMGGTSAAYAECQNPWGVAYEPGSKLVYIACNYNNNVTVVNVTTPTAPTATVIVSGTGPTNAGYTYDAAIGTAAADAGTYHPEGIKVDSSGNVYWVEGCNSSGGTYRQGGAVRVYAPSTTTILGTAVTGGTVKTIIGAQTNSPSSCTDSFTTTNPSQTFATTILQSAYDIAVYPATGTVTGLFISDSNRVLFANNTGSAQTFGELTSSTVPTSAPSGSVSYLINESNNTGTTEDGGIGVNTEVNAPEGLNLVGNTLYFADYGDYRIREFSLTAGTISTVLGAGYAKSGSAPSGVVPATQVFMSNPMDVVIDSVNNLLYYTDSSNQRIGQVNMITGAAQVLAGNGGSNYNDNIVDSTIGMYYPMQMAHTESLPAAESAFGTQLLFSDAYTNVTPNEPCLTRSINLTSGSSSIFGLTIGSQDVVSPVGMLGSGCASYTGITSNSTLTGSGTSLVLPQLANLGGYHRGIALAQDPSTGNPVLYIAIAEDNCILKVTQSGTVSVAVGVCQSTGGNNGSTVAISTSTAQLTTPADIFTDPVYPTNIFVTDQSNQNPAAIKYINFSTSTAQIFSNESVPAGEISGPIFTVSTSGTAYMNSVAANAYQICYSTGDNVSVTSGYSNVVCKNRQGTSSGAPILWCGSTNNAQGEAGGPLGTEEEGLTCLYSSLGNPVLMASPTRLTFDSAGNLYIVDRYNETIRMVARWY